jgi:hypothetical protein
MAGRETSSSAAEQFESDLAEAFERNRQNQRKKLERELRLRSAPGVSAGAVLEMNETLRTRLCEGIIAALEKKPREKGRRGGKPPAPGQKKSVGTAAQRAAFANALADALPDLISFDWDGRRHRAVNDQCRKANDCLMDTLATLYTAAQGSREFGAQTEVTAAMQGILLVAHQLSALEEILLTREYAVPSRPTAGDDSRGGIARATVIGLLYLQHINTAPSTIPFDRVCAAIANVVPTGSFYLPRDARRLAIKRLRDFVSIERKAGGPVEHQTLARVSRNWTLILDPTEWR